MATNAPANNVSIFSLVAALRRRKLFVVIPTLLIGAAFSLYAYWQPNLYRSQALLAAEHTTPPDYLKHVAPPALNIREHLWTVREVLFSPPVLEMAAREIKVYRELDRPLPQEALDAIKAAIDIKVESDHTFQVFFEGIDRQEVMNVTNRLAELFVRTASADRQQRVQEAADVIDKELNALKQRLDTQSRQLHTYKAGNVYEMPDHLLENMRSVEMLRDTYQNKGTKISEDEARRSAILKEMRELEEKGSLDQPVVADKTPAETHLDGLRIKLNEMQARGMKTQHPDVVKLEGEIRDLERTVATQPKSRAHMSDAYLRYVDRKSELAAIEQRLDSYHKDQTALLSQIDSYSRRVESAPNHERVIEDMKREYQVGEQQFHSLLDKRMEANLARGFEKADSGIAFQVIEPAGLPEAPFSPQRERIVLMGIFAGLGLGLVVAFFIEQNDTTFASVDDFQAFTSLPLAGVIPRIDGQAGIVSVNDPESVAAEQYRILAMKIQQQCAAHRASVLLITSAAGGEGKSLTSINLAMSLAAMAGGPVLLLDADMRKPCIHEYLNLSAAPGNSFSGFLQKPDDDPANYVVKVKNLDVIPGSATSSNPVATLASPRARTLIDRLKQNYAFVVIDAPPTLPIADSHILSGLSDKVLFVVRARKTPRELFQHAVESFESTNLIGAVLNDVDYQRSRYAYAYEYYKEKAR